MGKKRLLLFHLLVFLSGLATAPGSHTSFDHQSDSLWEKSSFFLLPLVRGGEPPQQKPESKADLSLFDQAEFSFQKSKAQSLKGKTLEFDLARGFEFESRGPPLS